VNQKKIQLLLLLLLLLTTTAAAKAHPTTGIEGPEGK
jgi:hypothetical protein